MILLVTITIVRRLRRHSIGKRELVPLVHLVRRAENARFGVIHGRGVLAAAAPLACAVRDTAVGEVIAVRRLRTFVSALFR